MSDSLDVPQALIDDLAEQLYDMWFPKTVNKEAAMKKATMAELKKQLEEANARGMDFARKYREACDHNDELDATNTKLVKRGTELRAAMEQAIDFTTAYCDVRWPHDAEKCQSCSRPATLRTAADTCEEQRAMIRCANVLRKALHDAGGGTFLSRVTTNGEERTAF